MQIKRIIPFSFFLFVLLVSKSITMAAAADSQSSSSSPSEARVHIVYTERPQEGVDPDAFHVNTLASVLGSEEAAKEALIYTYKHAASGFSAKLTPQQVAELSKQPGVLQVVPSQSVQLHSGTTKLNV